MKSVYWEAFSVDDEMQRCRLRLEKLKERFDAAIISNAVVVFMLFVIYIVNVRGEAALTPLLSTVLLAVYAPASVWAYVKKQPVLYIVLAALCMILSFQRVLMLVLAGLNIGYYFMTKGIIALKAKGGYPLFLPEKHDE